MTLLEQFRDKVLNTDGSFKLNDENKYFSFTRCTNGNAEYIYGYYKFYDGDFSNIDIKYNLVAILDKTERIIYIVDEYMFNIKFSKDFIYPAGCVGFSEYVAEENKYFNDVLFRRYYESIEVDINSVTDENFINYQKQQARRFILLGDLGDETNLPKFNYTFTFNDIAKMICGYTNIEDEANERFMDNRDSITKIKLQKELIEKYIEEKSVVEDWEIELARSINNLKANYVNIEFNFNGNIGTEKINPKKIIRILIDNDYFSDYNFATSKSGDKLLKTLGVSNTYNKRETWLTCKHITKITYGRKTLYERKQNG